MNETVLFTKIIELNPPAGCTDDRSRDWLPVTVQIPNSSVRMTNRRPYPVGEYNVTNDGVITVDDDGVIGLKVDGRTIKKTPEGLSASMPINVGGGLDYNEDHNLISVKTGNGLDIGEIEGQKSGPLILKVNDKDFTFDEEGRLTLNVGLVGQQFDVVSTVNTGAEGTRPEVIGNNVRYKANETVTLYGKETVKAIVSLNIYCENWATNTQVYHCKFGCDGLTFADNLRYDFTINTTQLYTNATFTFSADTAEELSFTPFIEFVDETTRTINPDILATVSVMGTGYLKE